MVRDISITSDLEFHAGGTYVASDVLTFELSLDASRAPYASATFTVPLDEALAAAIDPIRTDTQPTVRIALVRDLGEDTEQQVFHWFEVRGVSRNYTQQTMTVRAATQEALTDTYVWNSTTAQTWPAGWNVSVVVENIIQTATNGVLDTTSRPTSYVLPEEYVWEPGDTATSVLQNVVQPTGLKIICDTYQGGAWRLIDPTLPVVPPGGSTVPCEYPYADVIEYEARNDLDAGHFADNVFLTYEWTNGAGATQRSYGRSETTALAPVWTSQRIEGRNPGGNQAAAALQNRLRLWGRERTLRLLWDLDLRPGHLLMLAHPDGTYDQGLVHSVTFREDGTMTVVTAVEPYDTGWVATGYTPASGVTVSSFEIRRVGSVVQFRCVATITSLPNVTTTGDATNTTVLTVPPGFAPAHIGSCNSSGVGRSADGIVQSTGELQVTAVSPDATQAGTVTLANVQVSLGGVYVVG